MSQDSPPFPPGTKFKIRLNFEQVEYTVLRDKSDSANGIVSEKSPLGEALLNGRTQYRVVDNGEEITYEFEILEVDSPPRPTVTPRDDETSNSKGPKRDGALVLLEEVSQRFNAPSECEIAWDPHQIYHFTDQDLELAQLWKGPNGSEHDYAKMLSARGAEKAAEEYYHSLGYRVRDVSLDQLNGTTRDWITHDLLLDGVIPIDVKNARTPFESSERYVDLCVPRFKYSRRHETVAIVGVLSPYLRLDMILDPSRIYFEAAPIRYLGETTRSTIQEMEHKFCDGTLENLTVGQNTIPPWLFDFPGEFYSRQYSNTQVIEELVQTDARRLSEYQNSPEYSPIPAFLLAGTALPAFLSNSLPRWQRRLYDELVEKRQGKFTLPDLFLTLLVHFLRVVSNESSYRDYNPERYRRLVFLRLRPRRHPLGLADPLNTIDDLISTLGKLWKLRHIAGLNEFATFRFEGSGILRGTRAGSHQVETILAYCGGFIKGKGKCGYSPLIIGKYEVCSECGRLICPKCGYCGSECLGYKKRGSGQIQGHMKSRR